MTEKLDICSICSHGFDDPVLRVCEHPVLKSVAVCVICLDSFTENRIQRKRKIHGNGANIYIQKKPISRILSLLTKN